MYFDIIKKIKIHTSAIYSRVKNILSLYVTQKVVLIIAVVALVLLVLYLVLFRAPGDFPTGRLIEIKSGMTLVDVSGYLKKKSVIRSELLFESFVTMFEGDDGAISGEYFFTKPLSSWSVARKITKGEYGITPIKVTIPEGATMYDIAHLFENKFPNFDSVKFLKIVAGKEGYLFPDTYLFLPNVKADQVAKALEKNFKKKVDKIKTDIVAFGKPLKDVIIMASILEKEARITKVRRTISGILWKRIEIGMPLQVDAVFSYINGKNTYDLTLKDLKINSPYNTYKYKGLPVGPISNPGLDSIEAAIHPNKTNNLYYLSDRKGNTYYAKNFNKHKKNKRLYIN